jgi:imidazolonepropionase-like amidohydrolase
MIQAQKKQTMRRRGGGHARKVDAWFASGAGSLLRAVLIFFACAGVMLTAAPQVRGEDVILIKNGTIVPVVGDPVPEGSLLIRDGRIAEIGRSISAPAGALILDAGGRFVYPGLVAAMTSIGVTGYPGAGNDTDETGVSTPQMDPYDAINPEDECIEVTRLGGVTTVLTASGSRSVINGKSVALNLEGYLAEDMVIKRHVAQIFNIGAKENGKYPSTLSGVLALLRSKFQQTLDYARKAEQAAHPDTGAEKPQSGERSMPFSRNLELEALVPVLQGKVPALFITSDEVTIRNAITLIKEFNLKGIIQARGGILKYADRLAEENIPVIWAGTTAIPSRWEAFDRNFNTAAVLAAKGVRFAFDPGGWGLGNRNVRNLPLPAGISVAYGLSEEEAIKAITIYPARILGLDDQVGSLERGKTANVVIWEGSPIQMRSRVHTVIINGKVIPQTSVQTRLRDRFEKIVRERMKK